ncbi:MAG: cysteine hydrolase [Clostridiales bacterium]|nr:cysteine hydrolase [Clostridiales bacterium]
MGRVLFVVDAQNDFIGGALGSAEAREAVGRLARLIRDFDGVIFVTQDTHGGDYMDTQEGKNLPVGHCVKGTEGWALHPDVEAALLGKRVVRIEKPTFGMALTGELRARIEREAPEAIEMAGFCTDICVVTNALLLKTAFPEIPVAVDASACAGSTPKAHDAALTVLRSCQVRVRNG